MARQRKYSEELRERATRMALEAIAAEGKRMVVHRRSAGQLDSPPAALRRGLQRAQHGGGPCPGVPSEGDERIAQLERENRELRRTNEMLRTSAAFSPQRSSTARPNCARA